MEPGLFWILEEGEGSSCFISSLLWKDPEKELELLTAGGDLAEKHPDAIFMWVGPTPTGLSLAESWGGEGEP